jgi:hypothetical protein
LEGICILEMHWQSSKETIERVKNYLLPICWADKSTWLMVRD